MNIEYILIRKRIKNLYIQIKDGKVIVKAPIRLSTEKIESMLKSKEAWIKKKINNVKETRDINLKEKDYIYILNNKVNIKYEYLNVSKIIVKLDEKKCIIYIPNGQVIDDELYKKIEIKLHNELKDIAVRYISQAMEKYIKMTSLTPKEIQVRRFKSIWGNCSSKKVIKINEKIIHYGIKQIEYVCLHEITHLKYMNHQKEFWSHIEKYMPDYKEAVKELK